MPQPSLTPLVAFAVSVALLLPAPLAARSVGKADPLTPRLAQLARLLTAEEPDRLGVLRSVPGRRFGGSGGRPDREGQAGRAAVPAGLYRDARLVSLRWWTFGDMSIATDLSADLAEADVPPGLVVALTPPDGDAARNADFVASRWAVEELGAQQGDRVALLAFYGTAAGRDEDHEQPPTLHLMLVRVAPTADGFRPASLRYGSLTAAVTHRTE